MHSLVQESDFACIDDDAAFGGDRPTRPAYANLTGLRADHKPYGPALQFSDVIAIEMALDLGHMRDHPLIREARCSLLANVLWHAWTERPCSIFYSRDHNQYVGLRRYVPRHHRLRYVIPAVDSLVGAALVTHARTRPSPFPSLRSSIHPTDRLLQAAEPMRRAGAICYVPSERVILRDEHRRPVPYRDTPETVAMRADIDEHNRFLHACSITIKHPGAAIDEAGFISITGQPRLDPTRTSARRIFNGDFAHGGRWYGPWWQSVPARLRLSICISDTATVEHDFANCHVRLLHALAGLAPPRGDPYLISDLPRHEVKLALNIMLNAGNASEARAAIVAELVGTYTGDADSRARLLMKAVRTRHRKLAGFWTSGVGLRLQTIDATICAHIQRHLRGLNVPVLSVHDSFLVPTTHGDLLLQVMEETFEETCRRLRDGEKCLTIWGRNGTAVLGGGR
jgi:hypothetical protein